MKSKKSSPLAILDNGMGIDTYVQVAVIGVMYSQLMGGDKYLTRLAI